MLGEWFPEAELKDRERKMNHVKPEQETDEPGTIFSCAQVAHNLICAASNT